LQHPVRVHYHIKATVFHEVLCCTSALESALDQYEAVLESLSDMSQCSNGDEATKARAIAIA